MARKPKVPALPPGSRRLLGLLVLSGFAGITFEIVWFRRLHLILGSESYSIALVLAAFMAGLGLGSHLFGRVADRVTPLVLYRRLELGIGLFGLASPLLLDAASVPYDLIRSIPGVSGGVLLAAKFVLSFVLLLPPTLLMGGTLPAAARALTSDFGNRGPAFALAYGVNAAGAGLAALAAPFALLPSIGHVRTMLLAAACNLVVFGLARGVDLARPEPDVETRPGRAGETFRLLQVPFFLTGFVALAAETVWNRLFSFFFTSSVYTFSLILFVYLVTLAAGSLSYPLVRRRFPDAGRVFAWCQGVIAIGLLLSTVAIDRAPMVLLSLFGGPTTSFSAFFVASGVTLALFTAPITFLFGLSFPSGIAYATERAPHLGRDIGRLLLWNTFGTAVASIVVTFVLFEAFGSRWTLLSLAVLMAANHLVVAGALRSARHRWIAAGVGTAVLVVGAMTSWNLGNFHLLLAQRPLQVLRDYHSGRLESNLAQTEVLAFIDGPAATVSAVRVEEKFNALYINGKPDASEERYDMETQYLTGILPVLLGPRPAEESSVLIVGLGAGVTTAAAEAAGVRDLTTVELSETVRDVAARYFQKANEGVLERTHVVIDDGRSYMQQLDRKYDVIISEPSNPWITGVSNLFTDEYWRSVREHLADDGVFCQWMQYYQIAPEVVFGLVKTLRATFPNVHAFLLESGDMVFVASSAEIAPRWNRLADPPEAVLRMVRSIGFDDPTDVLDRYVWSPAVSATVDSRYPPNVDDRPWLEFDAPRFLFDDSAQQNPTRIVGRIPDSVVRSPIVLPAPPDDAPTLLPPFGLDLRGLPSGLTRRAPSLEVRWSVAPDGRAAGRAWIVVGFDGPEGVSLEIRSPLIRVPPTVEEAAELLRDRLGGDADFGSSSVHGHQAIGARSTTDPGRVLLFWYCDETRRNYLVDQHLGPGGDASRVFVPQCVHAEDRPDPS